MQRLAIINVVGLTNRHIGDSTPKISAFVSRKENRLARIRPDVPAVTCSAQATYLTGLIPRNHGIVGNGWYDREYAEHRFWKQSNRLVHGKKLWEAIRDIDPHTTCANLFWWFNMYSTADITVTPRPIYCADGKKVFDIASTPAEVANTLKKRIGRFPFQHFWGPMADIKSSEWIAKAAQWVEQHYQPHIKLVYLPHLDYNLQRLGPNDPAIEQDLQEIDAIVGNLIEYFEERATKVVLLSEYGITPVDRPVHLNRIFREHGWISIKEELGHDTLDLGACQAFAIADHQVAHVYVNNPAIHDKVKAVLEATDGVEEVIGGQMLHFSGLNHSRAGDLVVVSDARSWFTYYFWEDDRLAPDYARTVDIHRKPGYDPVELFFDPKVSMPKVKASRKVLGSTMGFRTLMNVVPLDATLVKGSHGRVPENMDDWPLLIGHLPQLTRLDMIQAKEVYGHLYQRCLTDE